MINIVWKDSTRRVTGVEGEGHLQQQSVIKKQRPKFLASAAVAVKVQMFSLELFFLFPIKLLRRNLFLFAFLWEDKEQYDREDYYEGTAADERPVPPQPASTGGAENSPVTEMVGCAADSVAIYLGTYRVPLAIRPVAERKIAFITKAQVIRRKLNAYRCFRTKFYARSYREAGAANDESVSVRMT